MHKINFALASSAAIETALSRRIEDIRLSRNVTQARLAEQAGVSRSTITRLVQDGKGISLDSFIRILQALELSDQLRTLLPDPGISPLEQLQLQSKKEGKTRKRARSKKPVAAKAWTWGDEDTPS